MLSFLGMVIARMLNHMKINRFFVRCQIVRLGVLMYIVIRSENVKFHEISNDGLEHEFCFSRSHIYIQDILRNFSWKDFAEIALHCSGAVADRE